jgi:hypothetical protein
MKRVICLAAVAAGAILAGAGCASHQAVPAARAASATPFAVRAPVATPVMPPESTGPPSGPSIPPAHPASPPPPAKPPAAASTNAACTVSTDTLTSALKASSDQRFSAIATYALLTEPECYQGFASARAEPKQAGQASRVLFGYDTATKAWRPLNVGSAGYCEGFAPDAVAVHFTGCA